MISNVEAKMKSTTIITLLICFSLIGSRQILAQARNEFAFSLGAGSLQVEPDGGANVVFSFSYRFHITQHISAEGALDAFFYNQMSGPSDNRHVYRDGNLGAEVAVAYYFLPNRDTNRFLPFINVGIGKNTTDWTEIRAHPYYRFGGGFQYNMSDKWGLRVEIRNDLLKDLYLAKKPNANLISARLGIVRRF
jgi:hypothetical protein